MLSVSSASIYLFILFSWRVLEKERNEEGETKNGEWCLEEGAEFTKDERGRRVYRAVSIITFQSDLFHCGAREGSVGI